MQQSLDDSPPQLKVEEEEEYALVELHGIGTFTFICRGRVPFVNPSISCAPMSSNILIVSDIPLRNRSLETESIPMTRTFGGLFLGEPWILGLGPAFSQYFTFFRTSSLFPFGTRAWKFL
jgi:hypothetical protein